MKYRPAHWDHTRLLTLAFFLLGQPVAQARTTPGITGATLTDGTGNPPLTNAVVLVKGDRNTKVGTAETIRIPHAGGRIGAAGDFVLPGLIDTYLLLELVGLSQVGELPPE